LTVFYLYFVINSALSPVPCVPSLHVQGRLYLTHYTVTSSQFGAQTPRGLRICMSVARVRSHTVGPFKFALLFACEHVWTSWKLSERRK